MSSFLAVLDDATTLHFKAALLDSSNTWNQLLSLSEFLWDSSTVPTEAEPDDPNTKAFVQDEQRQELRAVLRFDG